MKLKGLDIEVIAGPCSAESCEQLVATAKALSAIGVKAFRAGVWKPRTKPGGFEGVGEIALEWLQQVKSITGMSVFCEVATAEHLRAALQSGIDGVWIGARTVANPFNVQALADALQELFAANPNLRQMPLLVKNPVNPDVELWCGAVERLKNAGACNIILVHRGFSSYIPPQYSKTQRYRNSPLWHIAIEMKRRYPSMIMLCDPSHIGGSRELIAPICRQAIELMFDGLMVESHIEPDKALSDSAQQVTPAQLEEILSHLDVRSNRAGAEILTSLREQIDVLDGEVLELLAKRMGISRQIGEIKRQNAMPVLQNERYSQLLNNRIEIAAQMGLNEEFAKELVELVHRYSVGVQMEDSEKSEESNPTSV